jgi:hypothetical protein
MHVRLRRIADKPFREKRRSVRRRRNKLRIRHQLMELTRATEQFSPIGELLRVS